MNITFKSVTLMLAVLFVMTSCSTQERNGDMQGDTTFATPEEAAEKAKSDLISVLESRQDLNLGIDLSRLKNAEPAPLFPSTEVDFPKLLKMESVSSLMDIASGQSMIAPFVSGDEVVAVTEVARREDSWQVSGLGNKDLQNDLNRAGLVNVQPGTMTLYTIPNLNVKVFGIKSAEGETYHASFQQFTYGDTLTISMLYPVLREHAMRFEKQFGPELKDGRLVR